MSEINKENYLQKIAEIAKNKTIISCTTGAYLPQKTPINKVKNKKDMKEWKLKDPYACENFKEFGCIKDYCNCYSLTDVSEDYYCEARFIDGDKLKQKTTYSDEDLKKCWDASSAYAISSHKDFKQTHPNFNEWIKELKKINKMDKKEFTLDNELAKELSLKCDKSQEYRIYSEEDLKKAYCKGGNLDYYIMISTKEGNEILKEWFDQFKIEE